MKTRTRKVEKIGVKRVSVFNSSLMLRGSIVLTVGALFILSMAACGSSSDSSVSNLSGAIAIDGSSTVYPITEAVAEEFQIANPDTRVTVGVSGTGGGFTKFCVGDTDISGASRPIKDNERELCAENGVEFVELRVGLDGLAVVKNRDNNYLDDLSMDQLAKVWGPTSEDSVMKWSQVDSSFPAEDIDLYGPGTDSGTFDFFTEEVNGEGGASRGDYTPSEDDNVLVTGISGNKHSMGYFGYAYYEENMDKLGIVSVNGVTPSNQTVSNGSYALSRPLYIYVSINSLQKKEQVLEFVRYYMSDEGIAMVNEVGYSNVPTDELEASRTAVEESVQ